jgi:hypothetical protein
MRNARNAEGGTAQPGRAIGPETARPSAEEIAALALELWKARGCPAGSSPAGRFPAGEPRKPAAGRSGMVAA